MDKLIQGIEEADEIYLEPLYDMSAAFAVDLQSKYFWPFFSRFAESFGTTLLKVKDNPEVVQAGYTALSQMIRMLLRSADQGGDSLTSLDLLQSSLNGLMKAKGLPVHSQKLAASALGQIIRR